MTTTARIRHKIATVEVRDMGGQSVAVCTLVDGRRFQHTYAFKSAEQAHDVAARVAVKGTVDLAHWVMLAASTAAVSRRYPSPEEYRARHEREMQRAA